MYRLALLGALVLLACQGEPMDPVARVLGELPDTSSLYPNRPQGMAVFANSRMDRHYGDMSGWTSVGGGAQNSRVVTQSAATCPGLTDDAAIEHVHPGPAGGQTHYAGSFDYTWGGDLDVVYVARCMYRPGVIEHHGSKTGFVRTESRGGADVYGTIESSGFRHFNFQSGLNALNANVNRYFDMRPFLDEPYWIEQVYVANTSGQADGEYHEWINRQKSLTLTNVNWGSCSDGVCGFIGIQEYWNTDGVLPGAGRHSQFLAHLLVAGR